MTATLLIQSVLAGLTNGYVYGLIGLGIAVIFRGARIINAMQGDFALIGAVFAYLVANNLGLPMPAGDSDLASRPAALPRSWSRGCWCGRQRSAEAPMIPTCW